jgi:hypothetical protein
MYRLYKEFKKIGEYNTISIAKQSMLKDDGVYNLIGNGRYRDSWVILNGVMYNQDSTTQQFKIGNVYAYTDPNKQYTRKIIRF